MECLADKTKNRFEIKKQQQQQQKIPCEPFILKRKKGSWNKKLKTTWC